MQQGTRIGLIVPRFKHSAVLRNLLKRRLRELARTELIPRAFFVDIVIRIRPNAYSATFAELTRDVKDVLEQLQRWHVAGEQDSAFNGLSPDESRKPL